MVNQRELELKMAADGSAAALRRIEQCEASGHADQNPYASALYRRFITPLAEAIMEDRKNLAKPGRHKAHAVLLKHLDEYAVALLSVRHAIQQCLYDDVATAPVAMFTRPLGRTIHAELVLSVFAESAPELFWELYDDLSRRHSRDERHRKIVFERQAKQAGIDLAAVDWGIGGREQVGGYLMELMRQIGLIDMVKANKSVRGKISVAYNVQLSDEAHQLVESITGLVAAVSPSRLPCVEQPIDWTSPIAGGYHTEEMRKTLRTCVRTQAVALKEVMQHDLSTVLAGLNALQSVRWRINKQILDIASSLAVSGRKDVGDLFVDFTEDKPDRLPWMDGKSKEEFTDNEMAEFLAWKSRVRQWHEQNKDRAKRQRRTRAALAVARQFTDYPALYFVYQSDFRGRFYALSSGVNPQGSDLQKALLEFADGKPLLTDEAKGWFMVSGANRYGVDKVPYPDRIAWVKRNHDNILRLVASPYDRDSLSWLADADKPMQFLAWAIEYAEWQRMGDLFMSRLAVGMDGSCNGLQNFSAMLRDEVGGVATNLVPSDSPKDIYDMVAKRTLELLEQTEEDDEDKAALRAKWLAHGLTRSVVKRSVMTLPYGSKRFSCAEFILTDYLQQGKAIDNFNPEEYPRAAQYLSFIVWRAIADVVVKAREAMDYLQRCVKPIMLREPGFIKWFSPTGFPVVQVYNKQTKHRINSLIMGGSKVLVYTSTDEQDLAAHTNAIAPNFIHSMDAAHMCLTTLAAKREGIDALAMIHDDFGTHAADADRLYEIIREVFCSIYSNNQPIQEFAKSYGFPFTIATGNLDINQVKDSLYFFG